MAEFRDVAKCSMVEVDRRFRGAYCLRHQVDESLNFYSTTRCNNPEDSHLHTRRENLKSHKVICVYVFM
jgi:hypothetical protein